MPDRGSMFFSWTSWGPSWYLLCTRVGCATVHADILFTTGSDMHPLKTGWLHATEVEWLWENNFIVFLWVSEVGCVDLVQFRRGWLHSIRTDWVKRLCVEFLVTEASVRPAIHANLLDAPSRVGKPHCYLVRRQTSLSREKITINLVGIRIEPMHAQPVTQWLSSLTILL